jgi:hypothetical protein
VLPNLSQAHWVARSTFLLSLVSGCLAVFYASLLQRTMGNFRSSEQVKEWWRSSRRQKSNADDEFRYVRTYRRPVDWETEDRFREALYNLRRWGSAERRNLGSRPELQSSVAAAILMSSPSMMINFAVGSFLTGIGVYLGFVWQNDLDPLATKSESLNVFICFLISLVFCYSFYGLPFLSKLWEDNRKSVGKEFEIERKLRKVYDVLQHLDEVGYEFFDGVASRQEALLPSMKILIMGLRFLDNRSCLEAIKAATEIEKLLTKWHPEIEKLKREMEEFRVRQGDGEDGGET